MLFYFLLRKNIQRGKRRKDRQRQSGKEKTTKIKWKKKKVKLNRKILFDFIIIKDLSRKEIGNMNIIIVLDFYRYVNTFINICVFLLISGSESTSQLYRKKFHEKFYIFFFMNDLQILISYLLCETYFLKRLMLIRLFISSFPFYLSHQTTLEFQLELANKKLSSILLIHCEVQLDLEVLN